ncbi:TlpA disulfide reductase family protein [uncultured Kordia sp.]|uniref:TlpA family protein disulfide reductase n=1 Tax=uncultured Kordia sp. TaxID=507699 RepID=UPI002624A0D3|nr:TlpA disulfide reductase family protein [uncultured Kordia sp.]
MKKLLPIFAFILLCQCKSEPKKTPQTKLPVPTEKIRIEKKNEIVISVHDTVDEFFTNFYVDEFQDKPDMLYLGKKKQRTSITIPTEKNIRILGGDPFVAFNYVLTIEKGDSVMISIDRIQLSNTKHVDFPVFEIPTSTKNWAEFNFDYLHYKKNIREGGIVLDTTKEYPISSLNLEKSLTNGHFLLDSLMEIDKITTTFFNEKKQLVQLKHAANKIRKANQKNEVIDLDSIGIQLNDANLLDNQEYIFAIRAYIDYTYFKKKRRVKNSKRFDLILAKETFLNTTSKEVILNSYLKSIYFLEKSKFKKYLEKFNAFNTNTELEEKWNTVLTYLNTNTKKLNTANRTVGLLSNLIEDRTFTFEEVLANQKGKIVLVDFWASWCAPCRQEMPALKNLKTTFNEDELQVIEISIDTDFNAWKRASKVEKIQLETHNYIISNWKKTNLYKNYNIKTIPRYLLFDKTGKIIDTDAPRPSTKALTELIQKQLL